MARVLMFLCLICAAVMAQAQDRSKAILVLDASGSMWGQIDGVNKITIAQEVIGGLLGTMPAEQELGLTVYGHRRKGDCGDIETLIQPGGDRRADIAAAVNRIKPKGKTPLSAAVIAAAEALKYTENRATVILVSDGRETCDFDPCEVGRQLEATGVDFTAHVIGFDVDDPADRAQLQCLAEETGGSFRTASTAGELADALQVVAEPTAPALFDLTLRAIEGAGGPRIDAGLSWKLIDATGKALLDSRAAAPVLPLLPGDYSVTVTRDGDGASETRSLSMQAEAKTLTLVLPAPPSLVQFRALEGVGGKEIVHGLHWQVIDDTGAVFLDSGDNNAPQMRLGRGSYRAVVIRKKDGAEVAQGFTVDEAEELVTVVLPELPPEPRTVHYRAQEGDGGRLIQDLLIWDIFAEDGSAVLDSERVNKGSIRLLPGAYRIEVLRPEDEAVAKARFEVSNSNQTVSLVLPEIILLATLEAAETGVAGSLLEVSWTGPNEKDDYISVTRADDSDGGWIEYTYVREGSPLNLLLPPEGGEFELRYVLNDGRKALARQKIMVTPVTASLTPPADLPAGGTVAVKWDGPDYRDDFLAVVKPGEDGWINYTYTRDGSPAAVQLPGEAGEYELIYTMNQKRHIIARVPISVTAVDFAVTAPASAVGGSTVMVAWSGPGYDNDFIAIAEAGAKDAAWSNYTYTREGSPLAVQVPLAPGRYELRYILNQDRIAMARQPIEVTEVTGSVSGPERAVAGAKVEVSWQGPGYKNDYVTISRIDQKPRDYLHYTYVRDGAPLLLQMPTEPGNYELRYVAVGKDSLALARQPIEVTPVSAALKIAASAAPGSNLEVSWRGPAYRNDYLTISRADDPNGYEVYRYTREGTPLNLKVPDQPGQYEVRYVLGQDRSVLQAVPLTVE